jgi:hypothetical protein
VVMLVDWGSGSFGKGGLLACLFGPPDSQNCLCEEGVVSIIGLMLRGTWGSYEAAHGVGFDRLVCGDDGGIGAASTKSCAQLSAIETVIAHDAYHPHQFLSSS